jgi:hypothetical protein
VSCKIRGHQLVLHRYPVIAMLILSRHICFSTLTIEPLGASNVFDWLMAKARQAQSETSSFPPISLLRVCQESRHQATRRLPRYISLPGTGEKLYYQPGLDRVYFDERTYRNTILGHTSQRLGGKFKPILGSETLDGIPPDRCFIGSWGIVDMDRYLNTFRKRPNKPQFAWIRGPPKPSLRGRLSPRTLLTRVRALFGVRNG